MELTRNGFFAQEMSKTPVDPTVDRLIRHNRCHGDDAQGPAAIDRVNALR